MEEAIIVGIKEWIAKLDSMTPEEKLASVTLDEVIFYDNTMILEWSGVMGFGQYTIHVSKEVQHDIDIEEEADVGYTLIGNSENMDIRNDKKIFLRHLLEQFIDKVDLSEEKAREAEWQKRQKEKEESTNEE